MLNNQPMGFYHPSMLIKDAQRHGLRVLPVDVTMIRMALHHRRRRMPAPACAWDFAMSRGLRAEAGRGHRARASERPFTSVDDLACRVPELRKDEMNTLAEIGALNPLREIHRRDALWQAERAVRRRGPAAGATGSQPKATSAAGAA